MGSVRRMGRMGPSTALRSSSALKELWRTGCSRRVPRAGRALCRRKRSSAKRALAHGPAAQNQELRGTGCLPVTTATMGGGVRLPRFVPLWPALPHRVFFFGEGKGCPTLRGVCTGGVSTRPLFYGEREAALRGWMGGLAWTPGEVKLLRLPAVAQKLWRALCKKGSSKVCKAGTGGEGPNGRPGLENDPPRPGVFLFFCVCTTTMECLRAGTMGHQMDQSDRTDQVLDAAGSESVFGGWD
ncbi:MAG: hypothetical protein JWR26_2141 [Pedosphaera sp.]|nr:hypothetical protein [Pedosphaera sp.]